MTTFKYSLGDTVALIESSEKGTVTARAEYQHDQNCYLVRYVAGDGRQIETWWSESAIAAPK